MSRSLANTTAARLTCVGLGLLSCFAPRTADATRRSVFYREVNLLAGYSQHEQWIDERKMSQSNSVGVEYYRKFANDYGNFLSADLQLRLSYHSTADDNESIAVEIHNAWVEYKLGLGKNLRFGHFSPAFGLEPAVDTHGTLLQTTNPEYRSKVWPRSRGRYLT